MIYWHVAYFPDNTFGFKFIMDLLLFARFVARSGNTTEFKCITFPVISFTVHTGKRYNSDLCLNKSLTTSCSVWFPARCIKVL